MAASENMLPNWVDSVSESIKHFSCIMTELVLMIFGTESDVTVTPATSTETLVDRSLVFLQNAVGTLSFDHFQLQLLKIFTLILISTAILIYMAWHIYGHRISERFMHSNRDAKANSPCTMK